MDPFVQAHIVRRLAPLISSFGAVQGVLSRISPSPANAAPEGAVATPADGDILAAIEPFMTGLASMKDADVDYIMHACLGVAQRKQGDQWANVMPSAGALAFQDIEFPEMAQIVFHVLKGSLGRFFPAAQPKG